MAGRVRLIVIDIDGTLLNSRKVVTEANKRALARAAESGVTVAVATGRVFHSIRHILADLGLDIPAIVHNGSLIKTAFSEEIISHLAVDRGVAAELVLDVAGQGFAPMAFYDDELYMDRIPDIEPLQVYLTLADLEPTLVPNLAEFIASRAEEPTHIGICGEEGEIAAAYTRLSGTYAGRLYVARSYFTMLEMHHPGVSKALAVERLAEKLGIQREEVMAIGDGYNDLEMLKYAGIGVAMGNAPEEVKAAADYVTHTNDMSGVAVAVRRFVLGDVE